MVIVTAKDRRGYTSAIYMIQILVLGGAGFLVLAFFSEDFWQDGLLTQWQGLPKKLKESALPIFTTD